MMLTIDITLVMLVLSSVCCLILLFIETPMQNTRNIHEQLFLDTCKKIKKLDLIVSNMSEKYDQLLTGYLFSNMTKKHNQKDEFSLYEEREGFYHHFCLNKNYQQYIKNLESCFTELNFLCRSLYKSYFLKCGGKYSKVPFYQRIFFKTKLTKEFNKNLSFARLFFSSIPYLQNYGSVAFKLLHSSDQYIYLYMFVYGFTDYQSPSKSVAKKWIKPHEILLENFQERVDYFESFLKNGVKYFIQGNSLTAIDKFDFQQAKFQDLFLTFKDKFDRFHDIIEYYKQYYGSYEYYHSDHIQTMQALEEKVCHLNEQFEERLQEAS